MATAPKILLDSCCLDPRLIGVDEANALPFYASGAKLCLIDGPAGKIDPNNLAEALAQPFYGVVHHRSPPRCRPRRPPSAVLFTDRGVPKTPDVDRRTAVSSSHLTPRWRRQSGANPSLKKPNSLFFRENTGNFRYSGANGTKGKLTIW
jgi:hypothetical protein